jgi:hypothetical protein
MGASTEAMEATESSKSPKMMSRLNRKLKSGHNNRITVAQSIGGRRGYGNNHGVNSANIGDSFFSENEWGVQGKQYTNMMLSLTGSLTSSENAKTNLV